MNWRVISVACVITAATVSGAVWLSNDERSDDSAAQHLPLNAPLVMDSPIKQNALVVPPWRFEPGDSLRYSLDYRGQLGASDFRLRGEVSIEAIANTGHAGESVAWVSFRPDVNVEHQPAPWLESILPSLADGVLVTVSPRGFDLTLTSVGAAVALGLPRVSLAPNIMLFWQTFFDRVTVRLPAHPVGLSFTQVEHQGGMSVDATYQLAAACAQSSTESLTFTKTWEGGDSVLGRQLQGSQEGQLRPGCQGLDSVRVNAREVLSGANQKFVADTELSLRWLGQERRNVAETKALAVQHLARHPAVVATKTDSDAIDSAVVGSLDESQLLALLRQQGGSDQLSQEQYLQLKSWLALHPETISNIRQTLQELPTDDPRLRGFVKALGAVGSAEAQDALAGMIRDYAGSPDFAARIVTTLGFVEHPTPAATAALVALAEHGSDLSVVQRAKLATGIMGSRLRQSSESDDQKRAAVLEDRFSQWLKAASTDAERYDALAALGNLGPKDLAALKMLPADAPARLQAEAYFAMRFSPDPSVPNLLAQSYDQYPGITGAAVRSGIMRALAARQPDSQWYQAAASLAAKSLPSADSIALAQALIKGAAADPASSGAVLDDLLARAADEATKTELAAYRQQLPSH